MYAWITPGTILLVAIYLIRVDRGIRSLLNEHEMLMIDYCERKGIKMEKLPTRSRRRFPV